MRGLFLALLLLPGTAAALTPGDLYDALLAWLKGTAGEPATGLYYETFYPSGPLVPGSDDISILGPSGAPLTAPADWRGLLVNLRTGDVVDTTLLPVLAQTDIMDTIAVGFPFCERSVRNGWNQDGFPQVEVGPRSYRLSLDRLEIASWMPLERNDELEGCVFRDAAPLPVWRRGDMWRRTVKP